MKFDQSGFLLRSKIIMSKYVLIFFATILFLCWDSDISMAQDIELRSFPGTERLNIASNGTNAVEIKGAKNEIESFQVRVRTFGRNISVIHAEVTDLISKNGRLNGKDIQVYREEFVMVRQSTPRSELPNGLYADPLIPIVAAKESNNPFSGEPLYSFSKQEKDKPVISAIPVEIRAGKEQVFWVDVIIPKGIPAGEYTGFFEVSTYDKPFGAIPKNDGKVSLSDNRNIKMSLVKKYQIPVTLTVWDFELPDKLSLRTSLETGSGRIQQAVKAYGVADNTPEFREIEKGYYRLLSSNRISSPVPSWLLPERGPDGSLQADPQRTKLLAGFIKEYNVADFQILSSVSHAPGNEANFIRYHKELYAYLKENGWADRAFLYIFDEPNTSEEYGEIVRIGKLLRKSIPELKHMVVEQTYTQDADFPDISHYVDIWCPLFSFIDSASVQNRLNKGQEVWSYTALAQRSPDYHPQYQKVKELDPYYWSIDQPLISYRAPAWMNWKYGITGLLYWTMVYQSGQSVTGIMDPWYNPVFHSSGRHFNGEGYMIYPGTPCGINGPVPSVRLKNIRDSIEDYEYFSILESLSDRETVLKFVDSVMPNWWAKPDLKTLLKVREAIAVEIVRLKARIN